MKKNLRSSDELDLEIERISKSMTEGYDFFNYLRRFDFGVKDVLREGANKQVISSQADSLIKISRIWADFFPANTSNQPI